MKNDDILYALTDIREDFLEEAAPVRRRPVRRQEAGEMRARSRHPRYLRELRPRMA